MITNHQTKWFKWIKLDEFPENHGINTNGVTDTQWQETRGSNSPPKSNLHLILKESPLGILKMCFQIRAIDIVRSKIFDALLLCICF